jgi:NAD(P)-dependent dehydrogenase (short-subunit alcohol dehydrogenase family)
MDGAVVLVTGAASGLGLAACQSFARLGARVHALARNDERAREAAEQIRAAVPGADVEPVACDVSRLDELRALAARYEDGRLDVLVNNAGVMPDERTRSADGHELMFATHVLAPFALTALLSDALQRSAPARVINVTSGGLYAQSLPGADVESEDIDYSPKRLYARTKREMVAITELWAQRLQGSGVVVHAMHPGWADTEGVRRWMPLFRAVTRPIIRTPEQGADTIVWLGAAPEPLACTGRLWHDRRTRPTSYRLGASPGDELDRRRVWEACRSALEAVAQPEGTGKATGLR